MKKLTSALVICTRNRPHDIINFLISAQKQLVKPEELIIVDSSDQPLGQQHQFQEQFNQIEFPSTALIYQHTQKAGTSYQRNVGAQLSKADILHFVDDDVILEPAYVQEMNTIFQNQEGYAGGMGCVTNVYPKTPTIHLALRVMFLLPRDYASGYFTLSGMPTFAYGTTQFKSVEALGGCCMSYRREIFLNYLFDEKLGQYAYMEDVDAAWRISRDYALFYNPAARLQHLKSPVNRAAIADRKALFIKNYSYLFFKNSYTRNKLTVLAYMWSIVGLFMCAFAARDRESIKGYWRGLRKVFLDKVLLEFVVMIKNSAQKK